MRNLLSVRTETAIYRNENSLKKYEIRETRNYGEK